MIAAEPIDRDIGSIMAAPRVCGSIGTTARGKRLSGGKALDPDAVGDHVYPLK